MSKKGRVEKPYSYPNQVPDEVQNQSPGMQRAYISAFNSAHRTAIEKGKSESKAREMGSKAGWLNVKRSYYCDQDGKWNPRKSRTPLKERYKVFSELPQDVQQLPTFAIKLWADTYNASTDKKLTKRCDLAWAAVKAMYWYEDSTGCWRYKKRVHGRKREFAGKLRAALQSHRQKRSLQFCNEEEPKKMPEKRKKTRRKGFFKVWVPLDSNDGERIIKVETDASTGKKFLIGIASGPMIDRDGERMGPDFIRKMAKQLPNLTVFAEHEHHLTKTLGFVASAKMVGKGEIQARTALEPEWDPGEESGNKLVSDILMKIEHGTPLGYSIAGYVTEFKDVYDEDLERTVPTAMDGLLDELTVTARPSYQSELSLSKAIGELRGDDEIDDEESGEEDERIEKFKHSSNTDPDEPKWGSVDKKSLPRIAHADVGTPNKKTTWKYPHHHIKSGGKKSDIGVYTTGTMYMNKGGVNAAWAALHGARSGQRGPAKVMAHVNSHRKALGLGKTLLRGDIDQMITCSMEFAIDHWDVQEDLEKSFSELALAIRLLKAGTLGKKHSAMLAGAIAKATKKVKAGLAVKVISDLYGMESYQQE